ncbi:MAG: hypothetical protein U1F98_18050 [Verrucomicrobiota bacterium]
MKMRTFLILTVLFLLGSLATCRVSGSRWPERVDVSFAVSMTVLAVGGAIACASAFALLQRGLAGQPLDSNLTLVTGLLGGLLLFQINWGLALALGLIAAAAIVARGFGHRKD